MARNLNAMPGKEHQHQSGAAVIFDKALNRIEETQSGPVGLDRNPKTQSLEGDFDCTCVARRVGKLARATIGLDSNDERGARSRKGCERRWLRKRGRRNHRAVALAACKTLAA